MSNTGEPSGGEDNQALALEPHRFGASAVVRVRGELDAYGAPRLETMCTDLLAEGVVSLVIDLADTTFLDSSGLRSILTMHRLVGGDNDGDFALGNPSESVSRLLEITGLSDYFVVRTDLEHTSPLDAEASPKPLRFSD